MEQLVEMSNRYGKDENYVLLGGGNTSYKEDGVMRVKGSGSALASVNPEDFIPMDTAKLLSLLEKPYPSDDDAREAEVLLDMMAAKVPQPGADAEKRPSVECILHAVFKNKFALHLHPAMINGLTCSNGGEQECLKILGKDVAWAPRAKPGYSLSKACYDAFNKFEAENGRPPQLMILQNHGIFISADTVEEIDALLSAVMAKLKARIKEEPYFTPVPEPPEADGHAAKLAELYASHNGSGESVFCVNSLVLDFAKDSASMEPLSLPYTPDHVVYCKGAPLYIKKGEDMDEAFATFAKTEGYAPKIVVIQDMGFFALGNTKREADNARLLFLDAMKITVYARSFGGPVTLTRDIVRFMVYWEFETYRLKQDKPVE